MRHIDLGKLIERTASGCYHLDQNCGQWMYYQRRLCTCRCAVCGEEDWPHPQSRVHGGRVIEINTGEIFWRRVEDGPDSVQEVAAAVEWPVGGWRATVVGVVVDVPGKLDTYVLWKVEEDKGSPAPPGVWYARLMGPGEQ